VSGPPHPQPQAPPRPPPSFWHGVARIATLAGVVMLRMHSNTLLTAAALLAFGTATAAQTEARFRARHGQSSDLADLLTMAFALATVLSCILALAATNRPR
jgi:hypothetical protein